MALQYLLAPTFQFVNTAGKPLSGGAYMEVYVHGTRTKYFCASDFDGTLHPFRIPLDSLGSNIVLANDTGSYDVYAYNRYGTLMMSRYNVKPGAGGGIGGTITSTDGSIDIHPTDDGVDLSVNGLDPSCLKVSADPRTTDGKFHFDTLVQEGDQAYVDNEGAIRLIKGWYHFTANVQLAWNAGARNETHQITLYTTLSNSVIDFDISHVHTETIELSGDVSIAEDGSELVIGVSGMPTGLEASVVGMDVHAITGKDGHDKYYAGTGITISNENYIAADFDSVQEKLVAGDNISITGNVISAPSLVQVNSDWDAEEGEPGYIENKPDLDVYATQAQLTYGLAGKQDVISDLSAIRSGAQAGSSAVQPADLAAVATTGDYNSLNNRPNLTVYATKTEVNNGLATKQDVIDDLSDIRSGALAGSTAVQPGDLATVATTGSYDDLVDKPSIPAAQLNSDWDATSGVTAILNRPNLATVATTGDYTDLVNKPSIPAAQVNADWDATSGVEQILNRPNLATVATTGAYSDLTGTPTIPTVSDNVAKLQYGVATYAQVVAAFNAGKSIYLYNGDTDDGVVSSDITFGDDGDEIIFSRHNAYGAAGSRTEYKVTSSNVWSTTTKSVAVPTVDQSYSASSANAQSGVAVAQAIAAIPSEVSTASGHFDLGGNVPVKVNYTRSSSTVISNVPLDMANETNYQGVAGSPTHQVNVFFDNTDGIQDLGTTYTGSLRCKVSSVLAGFPAGVVINGVSPLMYCQANSSVAGGPIINNAQFTVSGGDIGEQTVSVSGANPAVSGGYGRLMGFSIGITNPNTVDLTSALNSLIAEIEAGNIFELDWPSEVSGGLETTIPVVDQAYNASSANAQSGVAVAQAIAAIPSSSYTAGTGIDITNNVVSVDNTVVAMKSDLPTATSDLTNDSGFITLSDVPAQVNADWNSSSGASEILNKPTIPSGTQLVPAATSADADKVLTVDAQGTPAWASAQAPISAGDGVEITNNVVSAKVDGTTVTFNASGELQAAAAVTVDQTYNAASTNAQSGTAVAQAVATKEDVFDVGTGLEMDTSGSTPTLQVEAPVDIVAGPGIVIDNPDGNTLRVSQAQAEEVVLYSNNGAAQLPQSTVTLSENASNFEKVVVMYRDRFNNITNSTTFYTDNLTFGGEPTSRIFLSAPFLYESANPILARCSQYKFTAGNTLTFESCGNMLYTTTGVTCSYYTAANNQGTFIYKVVGIHRIAGGN